MRTEKNTLKETIAIQPAPDKGSDPIGKIAVLMVLVMSSMALFWFALSRVFVGEGGIIARSFSAAGSLGTFALMMACIGLTAVVMRSRIFFFIALFVGAFTIILFYPLHITQGIAALLLWVGCVLWQFNVRSDAKSRISFSAVKIIGAGLGGAITFVLIAVSFTYYGHLVQEENGSNRFMNDIIGISVSSVNRLLPKYIPDYQPEMTLDEFILGATSIDVSAPGLSDNPLIGDVIQEGITSAQGVITEQGRNQFLATFDISAEGTDTMDMVVRKIAEKRVGTVIERYKKFIPAILALSLFFVLNIFRFLYILLTVGCAWVLAKVAVGVHFFVVTTQTVQKEVVRLDSSR